MNDLSLRNNYEDRLNRVIDYIYGHLDDDIDMQVLADVACLSPYHWHRIYNAVLGESVTQTVKRLRLHRAAGFLANSTMPLEQIAARSGYPNTQSFSRTFKAVFGMPPMQYRREGSHARFRADRPGRAPDLFDVEIRSIPAFRTAGIDHTGSYMDIGRAFEQLMAWFGSRRLLSPEMEMIGVYYDDPASVAEDELRSRACLTIGDDVSLEAPVIETTVAGGDYAALLYKGPYADMKGAYGWIYGQWLPRSGYDPADAPPFERYLDNPRDTAPTELRTEICLPLGGRSGT